MGKWNRRYVPRRNFRKHEYDDPPSPPRPSIHSPSPGTGNNRVPSWEIDYCNSAKVPWRKILASKRYIYCYPTVLEWDASAGEDALRNAKQRYWSAISNLPCENPLPDPDMYIDEVDWNPYMDPELMAELELEAFDPDKVQDEYSQSQCNKNQSSIDDNPWERGGVEETGVSRGGWPMWDESVNCKNEDPWEQIWSCEKKVDSFKDNGWGNNNDSNYTSQQGWGRWGDDSRGYVGGNSGGNYFQTGSKRWGDKRNDSWNQRESEWQVNEQKNTGSWNFEGGGMSSGCRKRESFQHSNLKFKSSRCHGDTWQ